MQRLVKSATVRTAASSIRRSSFIGTMCQGKINAQELFPYPTSSLPQHVKDSMLDARGKLSQDNPDSWGLLIPDHFGGLGFPHPCVFDAVSHTAPTRYESMHFHGIVSYLIRSFADKEHSGRYLSAMSDGSKRVAWAVDEFASPNDPCGAATAVFQESSSTYIVDGEKVVCGDEAPSAFAVMCRVKRDPKNAMGWFFVEPGTPGVSYANGVLRLEKAVIPMDSLFIAPGDGYRAGMTAHLTAQYIVSAALVAQARAAVVAPTVSARGAVRLAATTYAVESVGAALAANIEVGVQDTFLEAAALSMLNAELLAALRDHSAPSHALERMMTQTAPLVLAAACSGVEDFAQVFNATSTLETMQLRTMRMAGLVDRFPELVVDKEIVQRTEKAVVSLGELVERTAIRQGTLAVHKQIELERIATAAAYLFSTAAVLSRSHRAVAGKVATAANEHAAAGVWAELALSAAERAMKTRAATSADSAHARIAAEILAQ